MNSVFLKSIKSMLFRNCGNDGMTLVEVMIATGLVGGLSLAVMSLVNISTTSMLTTRVTTDFNNLLSQIGAVIVNDSSCFVALTGTPLPIPTFVPDGMNLPSTTTVTNGGNGSITSNIRLFPNGGSGFSIGQGAQYGNLANVRFFLRQIGSATALPAPNPHGYWNIMADLIIYADRPGQLRSVKSTSSITGQTYNLTNEGTPFKLTIQINGSGAVSNCTGLRGGNNTPFNIPTCAAGWSVYSDGTNLSCRKTHCGVGEVPYGMGTVQDPQNPSRWDSNSVLCGTMPTTCPLLQFNVTDGSGTSPRYAASIPVIPGNNSAPKCQIVSCPEGSTPQLTAGIITSCQKGFLPMECSPKNADCYSDGTIRYSNFACLAPSYAPSSNKYFCVQDCSTASIPNGSCFLGPSFPNIGTSTLGTCPLGIGARFVWGSDLNNANPPSASFPLALDRSLSGFSSSKQVFCRMPNGVPCSTYGMQTYSTYFVQKCCGAGTGWSWSRSWRDAGCHGSGFTCPGSCSGSGSLSSGCTYNGYYLGPGIPANFSITCVSSGTCNISGGGMVAWSTYDCDCIAKNCTCSLAPGASSSVTSDSYQYCY